MDGDPGDARGIYRGWLRDATVPAQSGPRSADDPPRDLSAVDARREPLDITECGVHVRRVRREDVVPIIDRDVRDVRHNRRVQHRVLINRTLTASVTAFRRIR